MDRNIRRVLLVTALATGAIAPLTVAGAAGASTVKAGTVQAGTGAAGSRLWIERYHGGGDYSDAASALGVSASDGLVFSTGSVLNVDNGGIATFAYSAATGARKWGRLYPGLPGRSGTPGGASATSLVVGPGGRTVYVTGMDYVPDSSAIDFVTVAYDAATGKELWLRTLAASEVSMPAAVAVSPGGQVVYVAGTTGQDAPSAQYLLVAYSAATGRQLWAKRYGARTGYASAAALAVGPGGQTVYLTGRRVDAGGSATSYVTVAYRAGDGQQLWAASFGTGKDQEMPRAVAVSPSGKTVYVTGQGGAGMATVAYRAASGAQLWAARYGTSTADYGATSVVASPDGTSVYVTGGSYGTGALAKDMRYTTIAYRAGTGEQLWASRYGQTDDWANAIALSPGGADVYVTGRSVDADGGQVAATVAYSAATGAQLWDKRYTGAVSGVNQGRALAVDPVSGTVLVTGSSIGPGANTDYLTLAYRG